MTEREEWLEEKCVATQVRMVNTKGQPQKHRVLLAALDEAWHHGYQQAALETQQVEAPKVELNFSKLERPAAPNVVWFAPHQELTPYRLVQLLRESARLMVTKQERDQVVLPAAHPSLVIQELVLAIERQIGTVDE